MKKHNKKGKILFFIGIWLFAFGLAFNNSLGIIGDTPEFFSTISIPLIIVAVVLLIASNFYKERSEYN